MGHGSSHPFHCTPFLFVLSPLPSFHLRPQAVGFLEGMGVGVGWISILNMRVRACACRVCKLRLRELMLVLGSALHVCTKKDARRTEHKCCLYEARVCVCV